MMYLCQLAHIPFQQTTSVISMNKLYEIKFLQRDNVVIVSNTAILVQHLAGCWRFWGRHDQNNLELPPPEDKKVLKVKYSKKKDNKVLNYQISLQFFWIYIFYLSYQVIVSFYENAPPKDNKRPKKQKVEGNEDDQDDDDVIWITFTPTCYCRNFV